MRERKIEHPRKGKNRHQHTAAPLHSKPKGSERNEKASADSREEKPFKGMDIDKMNYTDI